MDKKKLSIIFMTFIGVCILSFSCYFCINMLKSTKVQSNRQQVIKDNGSSDALSVQSKVYDIVLAKSKIIFKTKYNKCGTYVINKEQEAGTLVGRTKEELNNIYASSGYQVSAMSDDEVVLIRQVDKYEPDKYVLGIKNGYIAIFKTDREGNMFIQDEKKDITDIRTDKLKEEDINLLTKGDKYFQCNTREDAQAILEDYE